MSDSAPVLVHLVEDDEAMRQAVSRWLTLASFRVVEHARAQPFLEAVEPDLPGVVVTDVRMPGMSGLALQARVRDLDPDLPVILFTGHGDIDMAVKAMRDGAYDFIEKPFNAERMLDSVRRACEKRRLVLENRRLRSQMHDLGSVHARLIGGSQAISALKREILDMAPVDANVLITGETGTGKEVVARCMHELGSRRGGPYVPLNCAAIPATLAESELFGHEAGAFTSASRRRKGCLEQAAGGTLFLDEMVSMPLDVQAKLLRAIQEREFNRLGSNQLVRSDFRLIAALNVDAREAVANQLLREDLYYRVNTIELRIPPLRERKDDIPMLFNVFCEQAAETYGREMAHPDAQTLTLLMRHDWPGNVRELKNVATRFILSSLPLENRLGALLKHGGAPEPVRVGLRDQVLSFERHVIQDALRRYDGNVKAVMDALDLPRRTLNEKMRRHGIERDLVECEQADRQ